MKSQVFPKEIREKVKFCFECGICTAICPMVELLPRKYNPRSLLQIAMSNPEKVIKDERLWLCAWCYKCYKSCPQGLKPPEIFEFLKERAIKKGIHEGFENAVSTIEENVPFPLVYWYTCFHPERTGIEDKNQIKYLNKISKHADKKTKKEILRKKLKVAIIGSGPSGLSAATQLAQKGYPVTIFESQPTIGGMLWKTMPEYRLPKEVTENLQEYLKNSNVEIKTNSTIGKDISFDKLWKIGYNAVFIAIGTQKSRNLRIKGENIEGVIDAIDFLWNIKRNPETWIKGKIAVIGGGNVAIDSARTALRYGAEEAVIYYRRSREEMPANPWEVNEAEKEGVKIEFLTLPKKIHGENGRISHVEFVKMKLNGIDETGRKIPMEIEGSEYKAKVDTLIIAIGEIPDTTFLPKEIKLDRDKKILTNPFTMQTTMKGVFAGGDTVTGPATVIEAIVAGKRAAEAIDSYLKNQFEGV